MLTGLGALTPVGLDVAAFTAALRAGRCGVRVVDGGASAVNAGPGIGDPAPPRLLAALPELGLPELLDPIAELDPDLRRRCLRAARRSPLPVRAALAAAVQAWQDAGLAQAPVPAERIGLVVAGHNLTGRQAFELYPTYLRQPGHLPPRFALQAQDTDHVGTISEALGIEGEGCTIGASSASGNAALIHAARLVHIGAVDVCLAVGAMAQLGPLEYQALVNLGVNAPTANPNTACRPFDRARSGIVPGEAAACVVVESAASAARRGAPAWAELAGHALVLSATSLSDPSPAGEARAMTQALAMAGISADRLDYINAHATGTPAGDDAETEALTRVLGPTTGRPWINATKALLGHCLSAAGMVEAVAVALQMRAGFVHGNPALHDPVNTQLRFVGPQAQPATIDYALSNSFGFGGFNSAVVLKRCGPDAQD
ncbi:MAG: polyketide beta-ketoacyl:ACP synthase [Catenulispora sp.]|nr:polyketide beta-ketoacyl:ACP synthase [Catenulispora sp.]